MACSAPKFDCKTCHGKDAQKNKFKMPNATLPKLDFAALQADAVHPGRCPRVPRAMVGEDVSVDAQVVAVVDEQAREFAGEFGGGVYCGVRWLLWPVIENEVWWVGPIRRIAPTPDGNGTPPI